MAVVGCDKAQTSQARDASAIDRIVDFCWYCFKWTLLFSIIAAAVWVPHLWQAVDERIRAEACAILAQCYRDMRVSIRSAQLIEGEAIVLEDVVLAADDGQGESKLLSCEKIVLACANRLPDLVRERPEISKITLYRPTIVLIRGPDGRWNAERLLPLPQFSSRPTPIVVSDGAVEVIDRSQLPSTRWRLQRFDAVVDPLVDERVEKDEAKSVAVAVVESNLPTGQACAQGEPETLRSERAEGSTWRCFRVEFSGDRVGAVRAEGTFDVRSLDFQLEGQAEQIEFGPDLLAALPSPLTEKAGGLSGLRARVEARFKVHHAAGAPAPWRFEIQGRAAEGRFEDARLPHPLTDVRTVFRLDDNGIVVDELTAKSNQATLRVNYRQSGWTDHAERTVEAEIRHLELDRRLLAVLPPAWQEHWYKYRPSGVIDVRARLHFDGTRWRPELHADCVNVSFSHYRFPYRLEEGRGSISLQDDLMTFSLTASTGRTAARLTGEIHHPGPQAVGWLEVRADDLPLDAKLAAAVPRETQPVLQMLGAQGALNVYARLWRDTPEGQMHRHLLLTAQRCSINFEKFPYPVRNITGVLEMFDDEWTFRNLQGMNDSGRITCRGSFGPSIHGKELRLEFTGRDIPLDQELRDALRPAEKQVWMAFRPRGAVDLTAEVRYLTETHQVSVTVRAEPQPETSAIEPVHFPYRLERLRGMLEYRDGHVVLHNIKAEHGAVRMSTGGWLHFDPDGRWRCRLEGLNVERLRIDRDLIPALPERLRRALTELRPSGPINIRGMFELGNTLDPDHALESQWAVSLGLQQCAFEFGPRVENINGTMTLVGRFDGRALVSMGELALDSLSYRDLQITEVRGPIFFDENQALLGAWAARYFATPEGRSAAARIEAVTIGDTPAADDRHERTGTGDPLSRTDAMYRARSLSGRTFGGIVTGDGWIVFGPTPQYGLRAELVGGDLARCARELLPGKQDLRGAIHAAVELRGQGRTTNLMQGRGAVRLRDADIYELPLMIALLKLLSIRLPDTKAFSSSDIEFRIEGEHVYFDRLDFNGDAVSLLGKGEMDFQQNIRLTFHAILGRGEPTMPLVRELFSGAAKQIMLIHVNGTLQNPEMRREALPGLNQALQQLQEERELQHSDDRAAGLRLSLPDRNARRPGDRLQSGAVVR